MGFMQATHIWVRIALGLPMFVQHGLYVGYPFVGLHRFAHLRPIWALCELPICGFALVLPMCSDIGFMWATHMWVALGLPMCV